VLIREIRGETNNHMSEKASHFSKKLLQRAPSGKLTINGRDEALTNIQAFYDDP
jgi:hypothetical protein